MRIWFNPCIPFSLGANLIDECSTELQKIGIFQAQLSLTSTIIMGLVCVSDLIASINNSGSYMFYVVQLSYVQCCCVTQYLRGFRKQCKLLSHSTTSGLRAISILQVYRQLQILDRYYNKIQQDVIIILFTFSGYLFVIGAFAIINNGSEAITLQLIVFVLVIVNGIAVLLVIFGAFAKLSMESDDTLKYLKRRFLSDYYSSKGSSSKEIKRFVLSMAPLQVNFGSVNYIGQSTPILLVNFCIHLLQSLLLCT